MRQGKVHLEDVTRAARQGFALALATSLLALDGMLFAGVSPAIAAAGAVALLVLGSASGGYGLVARVALRGSRPQRHAAASSDRSVAPLGMPQTR